jgi:hypothetical protein
LLLAGHESIQHSAFGSGEGRTIKAGFDLCLAAN